MPVSRYYKTFPGAVDFAELIAVFVLCGPSWPRRGLSDCRSYRTETTAAAFGDGGTWVVSAPSPPSALCPGILRRGAHLIRAAASQISLPLRRVGSGDQPAPGSGVSALTPPISRAVSGTIGSRSTFGSSPLVVAVGRSALVAGSWSLVVGRSR